LLLLLLLLLFVVVDVVVDVIVVVLCLTVLSSRMLSGMHYLVCLFVRLHCSVLYCIVLYCIVLYCNRIVKVISISM
jgi:hypothetical protein